MYENKVFRNFAHLVPPILLEALIPSFLSGHPRLISIGLVLSEVYLIIGITSLILSLVKVAQVLFGRHPFMQDKPNESYAQLIRIVVYIIAGIYLFSVILGKSPLGIFSALGAMSVVLMLVFKDTILGLVASIQLSANDMVKIGDWVDFPKYGADGTVLEIKLQTIKVENWDKTISTVPTYAFVSDAFKNWRGMEESGGRRIKRSINIDLNSIQICTEEMLTRFCKIEFIESYVKAKEQEIAVHNTEKKIDLSTLANGRRLSNVGTFRAYIVAYLKSNEKINKDMTFLVRQLAPTEIGLPIEIYVFSSEKRWAVYEDIQADIFDHLLSIAPQFDLSIFQIPTGADFKSLIK